MTNINTLTKKIPWGFAIIILFWIIVFVIFATRYHNNEQTVSKNSVSSNAVESLAMVTASDIIQEQLNSPLLSKSDYSESLSLSKIHQHIHMINLTQNTIFLPYGELSAIYNPATKHYSLFLNQLPFAQIDNPVIIYAFILSNQKIVIIFDAETIGDDKIYTLLEISNNSQRVIKEVGNYEALIDASLNKTQTCVILKFIDSRKYSDDSDYQVYRYCGTGNNITKIMDVKPDSYYHNKFSELSAQDVLTLAQSESCYSSSDNKLILNQRCDYGIKYCYMLKLIQRSSDINYQRLAELCQQRTRGLFINQKNKSNSLSDRK